METASPRTWGIQTEGKMAPKRSIPTLWETVTSQSWPQGPFFQAHPIQTVLLQPGGATELSLCHLLARPHDMCVTCPFLLSPHLPILTWCPTCQSAEYQPHW